MVNGDLYHSEYGMPAALFTQRGPLLAVPGWDRSTLNAGGFTSLGGDAVLRFRAFYVNYDNTLDHVQRPSHDHSRHVEHLRQFRSTAASALAELPTGDWNTVKASLLYQKDIARIQDNTGPRPGTGRSGNTLRRGSRTTSA